MAVSTSTKKVVCASFWLLFLLPTGFVRAVEKRDEHVALYAWPGGRSHGFVASTIAKRLAKDYKKVSLLVGTCDYSKLAPKAGPGVNVQEFPGAMPRSFEMVGMKQASPSDFTFDEFQEFVKRVSEWDDPVRSLKPIAMAAVENSIGMLQNHKVKAILESTTVLVADIAWSVYPIVLKKYPSIKVVVGYSPVGIMPGFVPRFLGTSYDATFGSRKNSISNLLAATKNVFLGAMNDMVVLPALMGPFCEHAVEIGVLTEQNVKLNGCTKEYFRGVVERIGINMVLSDPALELPMPLLPTFNFVGHVLSSPAAPLEGELQKWVGDADQGFVLVSLGTIGSLQQEALNVLTVELGNLAPIRVIWKLQGVKPTVKVPHNIKLVSWMPQNDLLGHPKVRAFLTHGGRNSLEESAYHGVPIVGVPLFGDQHDNLVRATRHGFCVIVDQSSITTASPYSPSLREAFLLALSEEFAKSASVVKNNIRAHKTPALDKVAEWVQYGIETGGAEHRVPLWVKDQKMYWELTMPHILLWGGVAAILSIALWLCYCCLKMAYSIIVRPTCAGRCTVEHTPSVEQKVATVSKHKEI